MAQTAATSASEWVAQTFTDHVVDPLFGLLFVDLAFWDNASGDAIQLPLVVAWLIAGATFFTLRMGLVPLWAFKHAVEVVSGAYDNPDEPGELSHFQALSSALSATIGLGNIAGVAVAVSMGGPGAVFWMVVAGVLGMSSKFTECTLGQMYRAVDTHGHVSGGPMRYLDRGLATLGLPRLGRVLAVVFAVMCILSSFGMGNMFQANQSYAQVAQVVPFLQDKPWLYGAALAALVALVILGGIRRIGRVASFIVPAMCAVYIAAACWVVAVHAKEVPQALVLIATDAFSLEAGIGGFIGVLVTGFRRAAFSNEAGIGSAPIAHSAAATSEPVREGIVALLEPFLDTVVVCTMTGLVVILTGTHLNPSQSGVVMTSSAFAREISWFPIPLALTAAAFAFSTVISWSYYGERCWSYLFGEGSALLYKWTFVAFIMLGCTLSLDTVLRFSDGLTLAMAFPNVLGMLLLSGQVRRALDDYWRRFKAGTMPRK